MTTIAPATPTPPVLAETQSLLTMGDLILLNPIQSTSIFFIIIICSTGLEYLFEVLENQRNAYWRNIIVSSKEELAAIAFSQMVLIFISLVVGFSATAKQVVLLATVMIVFMCFNFMVYVVIVNILQSRRALEWSTFEWARLDLDALHTKQEAYFKSARAVFLRRSKVGARVRSCLADGKEGPTSIMPVLFASYLGHVERSFLKESFDFTWVTWTALIGIVIVDGLRSITVNSMGSTDTVVTTQILTFVFVIGWGLLGMLMLVAYVQRKRLSTYVQKWNITGSFADVTATASAVRQRGEHEVQLDAGDDADRKPLKSDDEMAEGLSACYFFNSVGGALSMLHVFMLGLLWFSCVFVAGFVHLCWEKYGAIALFIYIAAGIPFFAAVTMVLPSALTDVFIAAAIGGDFNDELVTQAVNGEYDLRQVEVSDDDDDDGPSGGGGDNGGGKHRDFMPDSLNRALLEGAHADGGGGGGGDGEFDDEVDAPLEQVALGAGLGGAAPMHIRGVPPVSQEAAAAAAAASKARPGTYVWRERAPIFAAPMGNAGLGPSEMREL